MGQWNEYLEVLASKAPTPGGGSAAAVYGAVGTALGEMVGNLTTGKKKFAIYEEEIQKILVRLQEARMDFIRLEKADEQAFEPLSEVYRMKAETEDEKKAAEAAETENKDLFEEIKKDLNGKVKEVKVNPTLQEHPVTLTAEGGISMEMEKVLRCMPNAEGVESTKVLELNPNHTVFAALKAAHAAGDADKVAKYAELLYDQALLIAGLPIEDPVAYAQHRQPPP